jgi:hypothetical protein
VDRPHSYFPVFWRPIPIGARVVLQGPRAPIAGIPQNGDDCQLLFTDSLPLGEFRTQIGLDQAACTNSGGRTTAGPMGLRRVGWQS